MINELIIDFVVSRPELNFTGGGCWLVSVHEDRYGKDGLMVADGAPSDSSAMPCQVIVTLIVCVDDANTDEEQDDGPVKPPHPGQVTYNNGDRRKFYAALRLSEAECSIFFG